MCSSNDAPAQRPTPRVTTRPTTRPTQRPTPHPTPRSTPRPTPLLNMARSLETGAVAAALLGILALALLRGPYERMWHRDAPARPSAAPNDHVDECLNLHGSTRLATEQALANFTYALEASFNVSASSFSELITQSLRYREEGEPHLARLLVTAAACSHPRWNVVPIGEAREVDFLTILKVCAPILPKTWLILVQLCALHAGERNVVYGLLPPATDSTTHELRGTGPSLLLVVNQTGQVNLDFVDSDNLHGRLCLQSLEDTLQNKGVSNAQQMSAKILSRVGSQVSNQSRQQVMQVLSRVIGRTGERHGFILVVVDNTNDLWKAPFDADEGIRLQLLPQPIDLMDLLAGTPEDLIVNMLGTDGITIFNPKAQLIAFRGFVALDTTSKVLGGARRLAFDSLKRTYSDYILAAYFQSQDGGNIYFESPTRDTIPL